MTDDRIDFSPLDPTQDPRCFEDIITSIMAGAADELAARRSEGDIFSQVARLWKPLLAAAAIAAIVSVATLSNLPATRPAEPSETTLEEALGMPVQVAEWLRSDEAPTPVELLVTLEDG